ncbi:MAG: zinc transporter ZupT [Candidatus Pacebacteria bacterium]|nr:zinc transporter ZupT [Candidatus Paceibacterota bacterium]
MLYAFLLTVLAGLSTLLGSLIIFFIKKPRQCYLNIAMGFAAGVMIFVALTELLVESIEGLGYPGAMLSFFFGIGLIILLDTFIPHTYEAEISCECKDFRQMKDGRLARCGLLIALGVAIHNLPEGVAVFFSSLADQRLGLTLAIAIALHNIPEGIAIAMPIYYASRSRKKAFWWSFLSGITEPLAALAAFLVFGSFISERLLGAIIGAVAGVMVFISFDELLPFAYKQEKDNLTILGIFSGMAVMAVSLMVV